jgi:RNA polymerase sigma factor (sigma-70 family)
MNDESDDLIPTRWSLIARLKDWDDQESWREFFDTYWKLIYGVAIKSGLTHAEAQDVVQETVRSVSKSMKEFKADAAFGSFKSWLLHLTRWRITDQVRRRGREVRLADGGMPPGSGTDSTGTAIEARIPDPAGNALDRIWEAEWEKHVIEAALEKLKQQASARHYQAFYLHAIKQVPPAKVAETLGLNVDQVYLIKHRLAKLFDAAIKEVETQVG